MLNILCSLTNIGVVWYICKTLSNMVWVGFATYCVYFRDLLLSNVKLNDGNKKQFFLSLHFKTFLDMEVQTIILVFNVLP